jgi:hypothetical protein
LAFTVQNAPTVGYGKGDGQDASAKPRHQVIFKPQLQLGAPLACRENDKTSPQFAD